MTGIMQDVIVPVFVGVALLGFATWFCYCIYYVFARIFNVGNFYTKFMLNKKYKNGIQYSDDVLNFCKYAVQNRWKFRDLRKVCKHNPKKDEILYTYLLMLQLERQNKTPTKSDNKLKDFNGVFK